jgi:hypothetical protein
MPLERKIISITSGIALKVNIFTDIYRKFHPTKTLFFSEAQMNNPKDSTMIHLNKC